jgi:hypothetical protein
MPRHMARQWYNKCVSVTTVTSHNNRRAVEGVFSTWSGARWTVTLQWNT